MYGPTMSGLALLLLIQTAAQRTLAADCRHLPEPNAPRASSNDNRTPAGVLRDGVHTVRLVAGPATWRPDGPRGCAIRLHAFAEEGRPAQIPGPLIRVQAGAELRVIVRNDLTRSLWVRGLEDRDRGVLDSVEVPSAGSREFRFRATVPGAWSYWAGAAGRPESNEDGQLVGALIVDPPGVRKPDRVFVMTRWKPDPAGDFELNAINGRSWPHTERLTYTEGDSVRWKVINASDDLHMMHLHGFHFLMEKRGTAARDSVPNTLRNLTAVTSAVSPGEWLSIVWSPSRAGNWLFHCHLVVHMSADQRLDRMAGAPRDAHPVHGNHADEAMAGLILGVTVRPKAERGEPARVAAPAMPRTIRLFANERTGGFGTRPAMAFVAQEGSLEPARDSIRIPGTPILLTRGEPARIVVHNRLAFPIGVHWHGIELESFFDGVPGWSGMGRRLAPVIAPADSFVARLTPPRAGSFMYHVHSEVGDELASGLYGPLLVLETGQVFDAVHERLFVIATAGPNAGRNASPAFVNGTLTPDTLEMVAGTTYRLRFFNITSSDTHLLTVEGPAGLVRWRPVARDGADLGPEHATIQPARQASSAGVTQDFRFTPEAPGDYRIRVANRVVAGPPTGAVTIVPIRVRSQ